MKQKVCIASILLLGTVCAKANNYKVSSPDGRLAVKVECVDGKAFYSVELNGKQMLKPSALGLVANYGDFSQHLTMGAMKGTEKHLSYDMTRIKKSHIEKDVYEATIGFLNAKKDSMTLHLHVGNNDVAYKYEMIRPKKNNPKSVIIYNEVSGFNFPEQTTTFLCPQIGPMTGWERTKPSYEEEYTPNAPMTKKSQFGVGYTFPCLFKVGNDGWALVSETGVSSAYPASRLSDYDAAKGYTVAFPQKGENNGIGSEYAGIPLPGETPWRTITVGTTLAPIVETTIPYDVVEPLYEPTQQYKPSRYTWSWLIWQDESINYDDQVKMIDVAAAQGYEAILVDNWWDQRIGRDKIEKLAQYAKSKGFKFANYAKPQYMDAVLHKYGFRDWDSVLAAIGHGGLKEGQVFNKLVEAYDKENKKSLTDEQVLEAASETQEKLHIAKSKSGIVVKGIHDVAVRFSKCCNPIPGDEIVGFVTRGRGITIHRTDCINVINLPEDERGRLIDAEWQVAENPTSTEQYSTEIQIFANNRIGLFADISKVFTEKQIDITSMNVRTSKQGRATIIMTFDIHGTEELNRITDKIRQIDGVLDIQRTTG